MYDVEEDDHPHIEAGTVLFLLIMVLTLFYQLILNNAGPEL
jgi:hypothetical protein